MLTLVLSNIIFLPHLCCIQSPRLQTTCQLPTSSFDYRAPNLMLYLNTEFGPSMCFNEQAAYEELVYYRG